MTGAISRRRALLSLSDKTGLEDFGAALAKAGWEIVATDGTAAALDAAGVPVRRVDGLVPTPALFGGRLKTLTIEVFAGLLYRRGDPDDEAQMAAGGYPPIDLLAVTPYPFAARAAEPSPERPLVEVIDVGGPSMLRAAAKNFRSVYAIVDPADYPHVAQALDASGGDAAGDALRLRRRLAAKVFTVLSAYDAGIAAALSRDEPWREP
ncbi:hypothetical protein [Roseospira visakhapatnamensis]|uniref:AICAR transformylase/IMP cyclohydrolase PurH n=1 Tax=Roseospira visakhapatnamensis TaxID=390880 RepID=A0A7W6W8M7_9PROT|nr:hypothetical protein [Roseospira visakhapatnamensis]MBB4264576.1 AICAR transformylase/IMP cyclohydrolase PurH [Roseospira visakhapatnamensis]